RRAVHAHHERVVAVWDREPALVEPLGRQPEAPVEIHRGAVGHALELHEAVARALDLLARRWLALRTRLLFRLGWRLAPALDVRRGVHGIGRVIGVVVREEERVEEKAAVDEDA